MALTNDDLLAISQLLDVKLKAEIQPIRNDIQELRGELQAVDSRLEAEIQTLNAELQADMQTLKDELQADMQTLKADLQADMQTLKADLRAEIQAVDSRLGAEIHTVYNNLQSQIHQMKLFQETKMMPRLNTIESCYLSTYDRYKDSVEGYEALRADQEIMKQILMEHSTKLQKLA